MRKEQKLKKSQCRQFYIKFSISLIILWPLRFILGPYQRTGLLVGLRGDYLFKYIENYWQSNSLYVSTQLVDTFDYHFLSLNHYIETRFVGKVLRNEEWSLITKTPYMVFWTGDKFHDILKYTNSIQAQIYHPCWSIMWNKLSYITACAAFRMLNSWTRLPVKCESFGH